MNIQTLIPFLVYFVVVVLIGIYATKYSSRGISEFFIGGRSMSMFVVTLSEVAFAL